MTFFEQDYKPQYDTLSATIKIKPNTEARTAKSPQVVGFVAVTREHLSQWLQRLAQLEEEGKNCMFLRVAMWDAQGEYQLSGNVQHPAPYVREDAPPVQALGNQENVWF